MQLQTTAQAMPQQQYQANGLPMNAEHQAQFQNQMQNNTAYYHSHHIPYSTQQTGLEYYGAMPIQESQPQHSQATAQLAMDSEDTKKRGNAKDPNNEKELRKSLEANLGRDLTSVAKDVLESERTSRAEKTKQLFAMLWYVFYAHAYILRLTRPT